MLYATGLADLTEIRSLVQSVDRPVNVLLRPNGPTVAELANAGVRRISVGGAFAFVALGAVEAAAREFYGGTSGFFETAAAGKRAALAAFDS